MLASDFVRVSCVWDWSWKSSNMHGPSVASWFQGSAFETAWGYLWIKTIVLYVWLRYFFFLTGLEIWQISYMWVRWEKCRLQVPSSRDLRLVSRKKGQNRMVLVWRLSIQNRLKNRRPAASASQRPHRNLLVVHCGATSFWACLVNDLGRASRRHDRPHHLRDIYARPSQMCWGRLSCTSFSCLCFCEAMRII